jgi:hypothetical protein
MLPSLCNCLLISRLFLSAWISGQSPSVMPPFRVTPQKLHCTFRCRACTLETFIGAVRRLARDQHLPRVCARYGRIGRDWIPMHYVAKESNFRTSIVILVAVHALLMARQNFDRLSNVRHPKRRDSLKRSSARLAPSSIRESHDYHHFRVMLLQAFSSPPRNSS